MNNLGKLRKKDEVMSTMDIDQEDLSLSPFITNPPKKKIQNLNRDPS